MYEKTHHFGFSNAGRVMQASKLPEEDWSGGFNGGGWADPYWDEAIKLVGSEAILPWKSRA